LSSDRVLKILHTIASADPKGGGPIEAVKSIAKAMYARGHSVELATLDAPGNGFLNDIHEPVYALGPGRGKYGYSSRFQNWIQTHAREYDVVVVNGIWQFNSFSVWRALRGSETPYFVFTHGMLDPWFKRHYPLKHLKKWLYWPWAEYRVLRDSAAVLFTAEDERILARESFWLYRCTERVVQYGVEPPPVDMAQGKAAFFNKFPELEHRRLWLFLARMHPKKCGDYVIRAFAELKNSDPSLHLVMAGPDDSDCARDWKLLAENSGLRGRITWTGMIAGPVKWGALYAAELFVLPSHQENFGIAVVEALACGVPVVISKRINIWREIVSANAGIAGDDTLAATTAALREFDSLDTEARLAMKQNAMRCFDKHFVISRTVDRLLEIFREFKVGTGISGASATT